MIAGVNVIAADTEARHRNSSGTVRRPGARFFGNGRELTDEEADMILESPQGQQIVQMMHYSAVGTPAAVKEYLDEFAEHAGADELIVAHQATEVGQRLRSAELVAEVAGLVRV